jgi:hypothetical protein
MGREAAAGFDGLAVEPVAAADHRRLVPGGAPTTDMAQVSAWASGESRTLDSDAMDRILALLSSG